MWISSITKLWHVFRNYDFLVALSCINSRSSTFYAKIIYNFVAVEYICINAYINTNSYCLKFSHTYNFSVKFNKLKIIYFNATV